MAIIHQCIGHNSHGSRYPSPNSHGTLPQHPYELYLFFLILNSSFQDAFHGGENDPHFTTLHLTS